jgi:hypothetical protein
MAKYQIPSTKLQTNLKFQYSMTKTGLEFEISVIVICLLFVICDLEFRFLLFSKTARILYRPTKEVDPPGGHMKVRL